MANHHQNNGGNLSLVVIISLISLVCVGKPACAQQQQQEQPACAQQQQQEQPASAQQQQQEQQQQTQSANPLIEETCAQLDYQDYCVPLLESDPRSANADLNGLARITLERTTAILVDAANTTNEYLLNCTDYVTWGFLEYGKDCFVTGYKQFHQVLLYVEQGKLDLANPLAEATFEAVANANIPELKIINKMCTDMYKCCRIAQQMVALLR